MSGPQYVVNPITGRTVRASEEQAADLADLGARAVSTAEGQALQKGDANLDWAHDQGPIANAAAGVGAGLTLGLGPAALSYFGLIDPGKYDAMSTTGAFTAGEVGGMILPAALSGGEGLVARGLSRATPAGLMTMAGEGAEAIAARMLPEMGIMGKVAKPALSMAARGAAEGAIVNAAHAYSDSVVQDHPLTMSALAATTADGALMGGLIGGSIGGITGGLGAAAEGLTNKTVDVVGSGANGESRSAAYALKRAGATAEDLKGFASKEGGVLQAAKDLNSLMEEGGASYASQTGHIHSAVRDGVANNTRIAEDVISNLEKDAPHMAPVLDRFEARLQADLDAKYGNSVQRRLAQRELNPILEDLRNSGQTIEKTIRTEGEAAVPGAASGPKPVEPKEPDYPKAWNKQSRATVQEMKAAYKQEMAEYKAALADWKEASGGTPGKPGKTTTVKGQLDGNPVATWKDWHLSREAIAAKAASSPVIREALDVLDAELRSAMDSAGASASKEFTKPYTGAIAGRAMAEQFSEMTSKRVASELAGAGLKLDRPDIGTIAWGSLMGHPLGATALVAGKKLGGMLGRKLEPYLAEAAYRSAVGAKAEASRIAVQSRMTNGVRKFLKLAPRAAQAGVLDAKRAPKPEYSPKAFQETLEATENLLSAQHRQRVLEMAGQLQAIGQLRMAEAMVKQYDAAGLYLRYNMPPNPKMKAYGSPGKVPISGALDSKQMKFMMIDNAIKHPLSLIDRLEDGTINPVEVKAVKYVYPEFHAQLVETATSQLMEMKMEGKFLPTDKVALLGTALDEPIDSTLSKEFVDTIQAAHAVNHQPPPEPGPKPPVTDMTDYQTPTQRALG